MHPRAWVRHLGWVFEFHTKPGARHRDERMTSLGERRRFRREINTE